LRGWNNLGEQSDQQAVDERSQPDTQTPKRNAALPSQNRWNSGELDIFAQPLRDKIRSH
jgi:hypothetical protein